MLPSMSTTKQLPRAEWKDYFDRFTRAHLEDDTPGAATLEVVSPSFGDQVEASGVRLLGLAYDPKSNALEVALEGIDHLVFEPKEIWILEEEPGLIATIEVVERDGGKEIIYVRAAAALGSHDDASASP